MKHTHHGSRGEHGIDGSPRWNAHAHGRADEETDVLAELIQEARDLVGEADCPWFSSEPQLLAAAAADRVRSRTQRDELQRLKDIEILS
jgi:hypothetical protein